MAERPENGNWLMGLTQTNGGQKAVARMSACEIRGAARVIGNTAPGFRCPLNPGYRPRQSKWPGKPGHDKQIEREMR
jgi:hypothetical protein